MSPVDELTARAILDRGTRRAAAKSVLNRPDPKGPTALAITAAVGLCSWLAQSAPLEAPTWVHVMLIAGFSCTVVSVVDSWTLRRRLDAAITLLQLQEED